ncbi:MAG: septum formation initiator family protein [Alphaproteobacteria bacterium]|nr:septum formation initiator family protein [Alphaproteobacteria bacterium]
MSRPWISKRTKHTIWSVIGACIVGYFLYHTIQGDRGWLSMLRLKHEVSASEEKLERLQKERKELAHRVQLLRPESIDPDLLEEKSRELLNYSKPNEIIILTPAPEAEANGEKQKNK